MKCLKRNMQRFEYLPCIGLDSDLNEFGEHTGDYSHREYGTAVQYKGNISTPSGKVNPTFYGDDIRYTHILVMDNPDININEYGLIRWKGNLYDIQAVRPSLNSVSIALKKQTTVVSDPYVAPEPEVETDGQVPSEDNQDDT